MFFLTIIIFALIGLISWQYFIENVERSAAQIPQSKNIIFNDMAPIAMTTSQIVSEIEKYDEKPVLIYLYTTWCKICNENFAVINETAREFQNTDLQFIVLAIDRDITSDDLKQHLNKFGDIYFQSHFLAFKDGFREFLAKKGIHYKGHIPFTILLSRDGEVAMKFIGKKSKNYLRNKIIKVLYE